MRSIAKYLIAPEVFWGGLQRGLEAHQLWHHGTVGSGADCYCRVKAVESAKNSAIAIAKAGFLGLGGAVAHHLVGELQVNCNRDAVYWGVDDQYITTPLRKLFSPSTPNHHLDPAAQRAFGKLMPGAVELSRCVCSLYVHSHTSLRSDDPSSHIVTTIGDGWADTSILTRCGNTEAYQSSLGKTILGKAHRQSPVRCSYLVMYNVPMRLIATQSNWSSGRDEQPAPHTKAEAEPWA